MFLRPFETGWPTLGWRACAAFVRKYEGRMHPHVEVDQWQALERFGLVMC